MMFTGSAAALDVVTIMLFADVDTGRAGVDCEFDCGKDAAVVVVLVVVVIGALLLTVVDATQTTFNGGT